MKNKNRIKIMYGALITFALCASLGVTLARFVAPVEGNENAKNVVVETGNLLLNYTDGNVLDVKGIYPSRVYKKTFTVENIGTLRTTFTMGIKELTNTFLYDELVVSAVCTSYDATTNVISGTCSGFAEKPVPTASANLLSNISIDINKKYVYVLTITFKETGSAQNYNQGAELKGKINIFE